MDFLPDICLLKGESVTVLIPTRTLGPDMEEGVTWEREEVGNVLVSPGATSGMADHMRPHGTVAAFSLAFPKPYDRRLRGCRVVVRGEELSIVGDPRPISSPNCPTPWHYSAEAVACDG